MRLIRIILLSFWIPIALYANHPEIHFGVFAYLGKEETTRKYQPLADYLTRVTGKKIILEVLSQDEMNTKIKRNELDIITTNPTHFLTLRQQYAFSGAIATLTSYSKGVATSKLGGVIIVRSDSPIRSLLEIRGKTVATPSTKHMGGFRAQAYELYKHKIDLKNKETKIIETKGSHQEVVYSVLNHEADVGFIRDGILEEMIKKREINLSDIRVINEQKESTHPYIVSTSLYPEWPLCALPHIDDDDLKMILSALFAIKPTEKALLEAGIYGYTMPADYLEVEQLARELRLPPFDRLPAINYHDIWEQHQIGVITVGSLIILLLLYFSRERYYKKLLQQNEQRFRLLIENMHSGVAIYTPTEDGQDFIFQNINPSVTRIDKVTYKEAIGKKVSELFPGAEAMGIMDIFRRVNATGNAEHFPMSLYQDHHIVGWRENYIYKIPNGEIVAIYDDVTEQKNMEIKLQMMQYTIDHAQVPFYWADSESGTIFYVNQAACDALGYTYEELTSMSVYQIDPTFDEERWGEHNTLLGINPSARFETRHKRKDGTVFEIEIFVTQTNFNGTMFNSAFAIDITQRKYYEKALRKSEISLRKAQHIAHIGNWELDIKSNHLTWSNEIFRIFEIDALTFEASYDAFVQAIHPEDRTMVHDTYTRSLETKDKYTIDHRLLMKDGRIKWVREIGDTEYDSDGTPLISRGTIQDITKQIHIRHELEKAKADLEEANDSLLIKNNQLKELAMMDGLTHIANRRFFDEMYDKKYRESLRSKKSLAVLMIDVDHFKAYNDHYGHAAGDECLIEIAAALKASLKRPTDLVARYGGEEFVVILKDIDQRGVEIVANTLLKSVEDLSIVHEYSNTAKYVTISIGIAFKKGDNYISKEELLKQSDEALYMAKATGRNQLFIHQN